MTEGLPDFFEEGAFDAVEEILQEEEALDVEYATLIPTGGRRIHLPIRKDEEGNTIEQSIVDAAEMANVTVPESTQFFVDGNPVNGGTIITPDMQITAVGNVKGG
jgi:hypothetical protein